MQVQQADPNACMGNHSLLVFSRTAKFERTPEKTVPELTGQGWGDEHFSHCIVSAVLTDVWIWCGHFSPENQFSPRNRLAGFKPLSLLAYNLDQFRVLLWVVF